MYCIFNSFFLSDSRCVINLAGKFYEFNSFDSGFKADEKEIDIDFRIIGQDIFDAFYKINEDK